MDKPRQRIRMRPTIEDCAVEILKQVGSPMNYREIAQRVQTMRPIGGATPKKSVYAVLLRSERIYQLGAGLFSLAERKDISQNDDKG